VLLRTKPEMWNTSIDPPPSFSIIIVIPIFGSTFGAFALFLFEKVQYFCLRKQTGGESITKSLFYTNNKKLAFL
jgi:hypothetical protein